MEDIILIGFGGHAKSVADSIEQAGEYHIAGYTDTRASDSAAYQWLGTDDKLEHYFGYGITNAVISVGYMGAGNIRDKIYGKVKKIGYHLPVIIDKSAVIADGVQPGEGTFVGKDAVINADSRIGRMCIINSGAVIEHENIIGDYSHIAVRAVLCGNVSIGNHVFVGANATVIQNVQIGEGSIVGAGSTVLKNIEKNRKVHGVFAGDRFDSKRRKALHK